MSVYAVSFRIHEDVDYSRRYQSFTSALAAGATASWDETTSFVLVETSESIDAFCSRIYVHSAFDSSKDIYLVMDVEKKSARFRGKNKYPNTLQALIPYLTVL